MAATKYHGKNAKASFGGDFTNFYKWTIDFARDTAESTNVDGTKTRRTRVAGKITATGTVEVLWEPGTDFETTVGSSDTLALHRNANAASDGYYTGTAICSAISTPIDYGDTVRVTYTFIYDGAVTHAVA